MRQEKSQSSPCAIHRWNTLLQSEEFFMTPKNDENEIIETLCAQWEMKVEIIQHSACCSVSMSTTLGLYSWVNLLQSEDATSSATARRRRLLIRATYHWNPAVKKGRSWRSEKKGDNVCWQLCSWRFNIKCVSCTGRWLGSSTGNLLMGGSQGTARVPRDLHSHVVSLGW